MGPTRWALAGLLAVTFLLCSCSFDYGADLENTALLENTPSLHMRGLFHSVIRDGTTVMTIEAEEVKVFSQRSSREMTKLRFKQYNADGTLSATGEAVSAWQNIQTEDVVFDGPVKLEVLEDRTSIEAPWLSWTAETGMFTARPNDIVTIRRGQGTTIEGRGMILDTENRELSFTGGISGSIETP